VIDISMIDESTSNGKFICVIHLEYIIHDTWPQQNRQTTLAAQVEHNDGLHWFMIFWVLGRSNK